MSDVRERPILFSGPMVRALLAGTKTQTRRIVKPQPGAGLDETHGGRKSFDAYEPENNETGGVLPLGFADYNDRYWRCPYGKPGDRLWVRETFMLESNFGLEDEEGYQPPFKDGRPIKRGESPDWGKWWTQAHYAASDPKPELCKASDDDRMAGWKPSIHMPRWASRITLEITGVRVERLQEISEDDAEAEGAGFEYCEILQCSGSYRGGYANLWERINGDGTWDSNPWVWVVSFRRLVSA
jgi:hypothetical protein